MDNPRLEARSEVFMDDEGLKITKRCFFLAIGDDDHSGNAMTLVLSYNAFDEPTTKKIIVVKAKLSNLIIEMCPEVLKSITQLVPEFKAMFRFKDLFPNKVGMDRRIELFAPMHLVAELTMPKIRTASEEAIWNKINEFRAIRSKNKTEEEKKRLETYKDRVMIRKLKALDSKLKNIDFDIYIEVQKVGTNITGNQNFHEIRNQRLFEVGILKQEIRIKKEGRSLLINMGGLTLNTFFAFSEIYRFVKTYA